MNLFRLFHIPLLLLPMTARACPTEPMLRARLAQDPAAAAAAAFAEVQAAGTACSAEQINWAGRIAAALHFQRAIALEKSGAPHADVLAGLEAALRYAPLWQIYANRGDLRQAMKDANGQADYAAASADYQRALNAIEATDPKDDPVPTEVIASIFHKAERTRMLADAAVASPPQRDGLAGGLSARKVRNFVPESVAIPIQFEFKLTQFTPGGARAAEEMLRMLDAEGRPPITLIGHTDTRGDANLNLKLSRDRAEAVKLFLVKNGYQAAKIRTDGRGQVDDLHLEAGGDGYSQEEIWQIQRRVELKR